MSGPTCVLAWSLAEGDVLPGGETVLAVQRNPVSGLVSLTADDGSYRRFGRDDRVVVARRGLADAVADSAGRPGWRVAAFVASVRRGRRPCSVVRSGGGWCGG
jgi:hypothetical protein